MRIAQVSPLYESVPPRQYGGTERVVSYLTEELVKQGHDVTLFASGDSITSARLISPCAKAVRPVARNDFTIIPHLVMLEQLARDIDEFDVVHFHIDYLQYGFSRNITVPHLTTLHGRLDCPQLIPLYQEYSDAPVISISNAQRAPLPWLNWKGTVYHGLPKNHYTLNPKKGKYAAFLGRMSPEKGPDRAIEIAMKAGVPLKMAAKVGFPDEEYYEEKIKPLIAKSPHVEFIGEITESQKNEFLGGASVLLSPIDWPEPFGLVMIEALACGTPVIAYRNGSVPELISDGVSGFIVDNINAAVKAMGRISEIDRTKCRKYFDERFSSEAMARAYVGIYKSLIKMPSYSLFSGLNSWKTSSNSKTKYI